jgi:Myb/SANT-like DNA-binding domain
MNNTETKKRLANMTVIEKNLLADLCTKYQSVLENKRTDAVTVRVKEDTWKLLAEEFSAISTSGVQRQWNQLKHVRFITFLSIVNYK